MTLRPYSADLQKTFRDTLSTPGAPEVIDDAVPVTPVAIVAGNITTTVTADPTKRTTTLLSSTRNGSAGTTTMGTVPSAKVWRILSANMSGAQKGATAINGARIQANGTTILSIAFATITTGTVGETSQNSVTWSYWACPVLSAGQTLTLVSDGADVNPLEASVVYVEEAV